MMRQDVDHLEAVRLPAHRRNNVAQDYFFLSIVSRWIELKLTELLRVVNGPARERPRDGDHV